MDLGDLLTIMRRMHGAASNGDWDQVDSLDGQRSFFLDEISAAPVQDANICRAMISEIAELDLAVTELLNQSFEWTAGQTPGQTPGLESECGLGIDLTPQLLLTQ